MAIEKKEEAGKEGSAVPSLSAPSKLKSFKETVKEPSKLKQWYLDYLMSDYLFASIYVAVLLTIKAYFGVEWDTFFRGISLFYVIYAGMMVGVASKTVKSYYDKKAKLMELIAKTNDLRNVRL